MSVCGSRSSYLQGCRCPDCTAANTEYGYAYKIRTGIIQHPGQPGRPRLDGRCEWKACRQSGADWTYGYWLCGSHRGALIDGSACARDI